MLTNIKSKFTENPSLYYSMSIAATWAGVGSLMNGITMAREYGIVPCLRIVKAGKLLPGF